MLALLGAPTGVGEPSAERSEARSGTGALPISDGRLALVGIIRPQPWFAPQYWIPLLGMVLGNTLPGNSLGLDRLMESFSMLVMGLVSLPGMMTGQILQGGAPSTAVR